MDPQICPFHSDEFIRPSRLAEGQWLYVCPLTSNHPAPGEHRWLATDAPTRVADITGLATEYGLSTALPAAIAKLPGRWVEYGLVERAYARAAKKEFAALVDKFGHREIAPSHYTVSVFLAHVLGRLAKNGDVLLRHGPATGSWSYLTTVSWWALPPAPDWSTRLSWEEAGVAVDYLPSARAARAPKAAAKAPRASRATKAKTS